MYDLTYWPGHTGTEPAMPLCHAEKKEKEHEVGNGETLLLLHIIQKKKHRDIP